MTWINIVSNEIVCGDRPYGMYWAEIPDRPSELHVWNGAAWVIDPAKQAAADRLSTDNAELAVARSDNLLLTVLNMTPAQLAAEVDAAFTDPAQRVFMKRLLRIVVPTARRVFRT